MEKEKNYIKIEDKTFLDMLKELREELLYDKPLYKIIVARMKRFIKRKLSFKKFVNPTKQWINLIITKILYYSIWIVLPILILDLAWWKILIGFFIMHYTAGIILSTIFQLAHIVEKVKMPLPSKELGMKNTWAIHQLFTTSNFSTNNKIMNWFSGGLNFQVEHHLFPNISHIHYKKLSEICLFKIFIIYIVKIYLC